MLFHSSGQAEGIRRRSPLGVFAHRRSPHPWGQAANVPSEAMIRSVISVDEREGIAVLRMDDGKANAMRAAFFEDLDRSLDLIDGAPFLLTGFGKFFSAGLDLPALLPLGRTEIASLLEGLHEVFLRIYLWPAPVVAAINGHAIAGGCILALQSDRRLMSEGSFKIGINETALGVGVPAVALETFRSQLGTRRLERLALDGALLSPGEARQAGLVDEVTAPGDLFDRSLAEAARLSTVPRAAFVQAKSLLRRPFAELVRAHRSEDAHGWLDIWFSEATQARLREVVARLKGKDS